MIVYFVLKITNVIDVNYIWMFLIAGTVIIAIASVSKKLKAECDQEALSQEDGENAKVQARKQKVMVPPGMLGLSLDVVAVILMVIAWALAIKNNMLATGNEDFPRRNFVAFTIFCLIALVMSYLPKQIDGTNGVRGMKQARKLTFYNHVFALINALFGLGIVIRYHHLDSMDSIIGAILIFVFVAMMVLQGLDFLRRRGSDKTD